MISPRPLRSIEVTTMFSLFSAAVRFFSPALLLPILASVFMPCHARQGYVQIRCVIFQTSIGKGPETFASSTLLGILRECYLGWALSITVSISTNNWLAIQLRGCLLATLRDAACTGASRHCFAFACCFDGYTDSPRGRSIGRQTILYAHDYVKISCREV